MRITNHVTPAGACITNLDSMKHYMPCIVCSQRTFSERSLKSGEDYEKNHSKSQFCDTCEAKILFNRLKKYEDLEETGRLIELPCAIGDKECKMTIKEFLYRMNNKHDFSFYLNDKIVDMADLLDREDVIHYFEIEDNVVRLCI